MVKLVIVKLSSGLLSLCCSVNMYVCSVYEHMHLCIRICVCRCTCMYVDTVEPSKTDTIGEIIFVFYKEVSFIQGFLNYDIF